MARDDDKLAFSSAFRYMRVHMKGGVIVNSADGFGSPTIITHNLGYRPYVRLFVDYPDVAGLHPAYFWGGMISAQSQTIGSDYEIAFEVFTNRVEVGASDFLASSSANIPVYYRIYEEPQS